MSKAKRIFAITVITSSLLATGCADDRLSKGLMVAGGAGLGAYLGHTMAGPDNGLMGATIGAVAGGGLGYLFGNMSSK